MAAALGVGATWLGILRLTTATTASRHQGWPASFFVVTLVLLHLIVHVSVGRWGDRRIAGGNVPWMFSGFMVNAWEMLATIVAVVAGVVGFFTVLRVGLCCHALPNGAFAGAAGASLIGVNVIVGLGVFALLGTFTIGRLGAGTSGRGHGAGDRHDALVGALFLSMTTEYAPEIYSLFGEVLGVSSSELLPTAALGLLCIAVIFTLYRPLLLSSVSPETA